MPGIKSLRKVQLGREGTAGTEVAATAIWRGEGTIEDRSEVKFAQEDIGYLSGVDRTYMPKALGAINFPDTPATFEQLLHILEAGVKTATPVADGVGTGKIYTYTFPTTAANTIKTYTIEGGDNQQEEQMLYSFVEKFTLKGKASEALMMGADWLGRQVAIGTFTGSLAVPTVEEILFSKGKIYIDAASGTIGTTQKTNTLLGAELSVKTGWIPVWTADGAIYFSFNKSVAPEILMTVTFEHDGTGVAEVAAFKAQTARLIRLKIEGSALGTPGAYTYKTLMIDLAGKWEKFGKIDEQNGNDIVTGSFRARYNSTASKFAEIVVVNELAAVP